MGAQPWSCDTTSPGQHGGMDGGGRQPVGKGLTGTASAIPLSPWQGVQNPGKSFLCKGFLLDCDAEALGLLLVHFLAAWR